MHSAPKQILVNAHVNLKNDLSTEQLVETFKEIGATIKKAEPKVDMIFPEAARQKESKVPEAVSKHTG